MEAHGGPWRGCRTLNVQRVNFVPLAPCPLPFRYTQPKGQLPDYEEPVVLRTGKCSVEDFCMSIHKNILAELK
jgi:hypothetical protein